MSWIAGGVPNSRAGPVRTADLQPIHTRYEATVDFIGLTEPQSLTAVAVKLRRLLADSAPLAGFDRELASVRQCVAFLERETALPSPSPSEPEVIGFGEPEPRP